jgi:hypothetical protein
MNSLRSLFKNLLLSILLLTSIGMLAQEDRLSRARLLLDTKIPENIDKARLSIDSVVAHPQTQDDFMSWTVRAFIYFEIYKRTDKLKLNSSLRDTIFSSLLKSNTLSPDEAFAINNKKLLLNLSVGYFNIAKTIIQDSINDERSLIAYNRYKEKYLLVEPVTDFKQRDVEYYLTVGSIFSEVFIKDNNNTKAQNIAKVNLLKVLELQPENPSANINMGLMYYNQAANLTKSLDYGADFTQIDIVQDNIIKLAKQSEQFIIKVYIADNKNAKACEALYYVYRMLLDIPKSDSFKKQAQDLGIKFTEESQLKEEKNNEEKPK